MEGVELGERTAEVAEVAGAAGKKSVAQRCRRCCGDIAAVGEIGCERIVRMHPGSESSAHEIGVDGGEGGAGGQTEES